MTDNKNNTGDRNTGDRNTGNRNTGYRNTGDRNTGNRNTGDRNTGYRNTGDRNTGYRNTGDRNTGDRNTGYRNTGYRNTGYLNTITPTQGLLFNKLTTLWDYDGNCIISFPNYFYFDVKTTERIPRDNMTSEEKENNQDAESMGGFLREYEVDKTLHKNRKESFDNASKEDVAKTLELPNFDYNIFEEITGITKEDFDKKLGKQDNKTATMEIDGKKYRVQIIEEIE